MIPAKRRNLISSTIIILALLVAAGIYLLVDPETSRWMPRCVFRAVTGWDCPGCGSQRMLHALLNGDFRAAWGYNPCLFLFIPLLLIYLLLDLFPTRFPRLSRFFYSPATIIAWGVIILAWGIIRNII